MKGITFRMSIYLLVALVILPIPLLYILHGRENPWFILPVFTVSSGLACLWYYELNRNLWEILRLEKTFKGLIISLICLSFLTGLISEYLYVSKFELRDIGETGLACDRRKVRRYVNLAGFLLMVPVYAFTIVRVKKFLYARSWWFIILEVIFSFVGILTLRPSLKEEYSERFDNNQE